MLGSESTAVLMLPGLQDSGPHHWQSRWQASDRQLIRVEQPDWSTPDLERWSKVVEDAISEHAWPVYLVAHSFGCLAAVHASLSVQERIAGALLVAPADPEKFEITDRLPNAVLTFSSILVASRNDPWMSYQKANFWARCWGSQLVDAGDAGHINAESGYGDWSAGKVLLEDLKNRTQSLFENPATVSH